MVLSSTMAVMTATREAALALPPLPAPEQHRRRLLDAMAHTVSRKGYAATTIADLAAEARVSRRTFYEHFASKPDCLIALYEAASDQALEVLKGAIDPGRDWHTQVEHALRTYFATLACNPALLRTLFIAILGLGAEGLRARRRANQRLADFILMIVDGANRARAAPMSPALAMGIVGGINELILQAIEADEAQRLTELTAAAAQLARAVIDGSRQES
jgi:AcrR family transcriptional regulator